MACTRHAAPVMRERISFTLDGRAVEASPSETIWQVRAAAGQHIPHLCYAPEPGYRPDGNCRACMVEIDGERVLAASCLRRARRWHGGRRPAERAKGPRNGLGTAGRRPARTSHGPRSGFQCSGTGPTNRHRRKPLSRARPCPPDRSHPAMAVNLDACIHCNLCVRACREVQVNDVIGMAARGASSQIVFDFDDPMGDSTCVACGECVQACPTGRADAGHSWSTNQVRRRPRDARRQPSARSAASAARSPIT